jgi:hypothetical protein
MSFFGGDTSKAHFSVRVRFMAHKDETAREQRLRREAERSKLKEAGIKSAQYFQYQIKDAAGKANMKARAEKEAKRIEMATGVKMEVCEGCFL